MEAKHFSMKLVVGCLFILLLSAKNVCCKQKCDASTSEICSRSSQNNAAEEDKPIQAYTMNDECRTYEQNCSDSNSCPPWFYCDKKNSKCVCGNSHHQITICNQTQLRSAVLDCHCVNFDEKRKKTVAGVCFFNCENKNGKKSFQSVYHLLPSNLSELNKFMCEHHSLNRAGPLCGECKPDTYPLAYSYNLSCVHCPDGHKNWWKYILAAFLPLTIFYFVVLFFKISATSSHLHGFVLFSQVISVPAFIRVVLLMFSEKPEMLTVIKTTVSLYGIWNLDFFRTITPNICLQTSTLQTLSLDYLIAVYPLFLMIISYVLIELHDRNFRIIVFIWKPFRYVLLFFRRNWNSRTSVIDAYATFFLLSIVKFGSTSFDILVPAKLYSLHSNETTLVLYYDGSIEYFGKEHLPYATLAITVIVTFILVPLSFILLYPFRFFQHFLNYCFPTKLTNILHTFADSFLGCYKDGTEPGTCDCRWFAGLFMLLRCLLITVYGFTFGTMYFVCAIVLLLPFAVLIVTVQPFKDNVAHYSKINVAFILLIAMFYDTSSGIDVSQTKAIELQTTCVGITTVTAFIGLLYIPCAVIHWLFLRRNWSKNLLSKFKAWRQGYDWRELENDQDLEDSLPDRIVNPDQYHEGNLTNFSNVNNESRDNTLTNTY